MPTNEEIERMDQIMEDIERVLIYGTGGAVETNSNNGLVSIINTASTSDFIVRLTEDMFRHYMTGLETSTWIDTDYYRYTIDNNGRATVYPGSSIITAPGATPSGAYGGIWGVGTPTSHVDYKNYSVQELKHGKQTKFILTTKSGIKKEKIVLPNKVESERQNLSKGRIMGYKQHWENV